MSLWLQNLLVLCVVAACMVAVGRQLIGTFRLKKGAKLGSCCATGCEPQLSASKSTEKVVFIPSSSLRVRK
jgi:hypothetical protein